MTEGVFAEHFVGLALRIHVEGIAEVFLLETARAVIHVNVPVWIGAVVAGCNIFSILRKVYVDAGVLHALFYVRLAATLDVIKLRDRLPPLHLPKVLVPK